MARILIPLVASCVDRIASWCELFPLKENCMVLSCMHDGSRWDLCLKWVLKTWFCPVHYQGEYQIILEGGELNEQGETSYIFLVQNS